MTVSAKFSTFEQLRKEVDANGGLVVTTMGRLRDATGAAKLGVYVRQEIGSKLAGVGLGCFPPVENLTYQEEQLRIFRRGTPLGEVVEAVLAPSDFGDERLREAARGEGGEVLDQIRRLVCP